jgi:hypothetical protein
MEKMASNTTISLEQQTLEQESVNEQPLHSTLNNSSQVKKPATDVMLGPHKVIYHNFLQATNFGARLCK